MFVVSLELCCFFFYSFRTLLLLVFQFLSQSLSLSLSLPWDWDCQCEILRHDKTAMLMFDVKRVPQNGNVVKIFNIESWNANMRYSSLLRNPMCGDKRNECQRFLEKFVSKKISLFAINIYHNRQNFNHTRVTKKKNYRQRGKCYGAKRKKKSPKKKKYTTNINMLMKKLNIFSAYRLPILILLLL